MAENKIEQYLIDLMITYQQVDKNIWLLDDEDHFLQGVAIMWAEPLVIVRIEVMEIPKKPNLELFTKLLELNASDVIHGAYAIDKNKIILIDTLQYETMDKEDFRATLDSFSMALTDHYPILSKFREKSAGAEGMGA